MDIKNILIIPNQLKKETLEYAKKIVTFLNALSVNSIILSDAHTDIRGNKIQPSIFDFAIVLGGDGSVLMAEHFLQDHNIPIMCINFGHIGYLTECSPEEGFNCITSILQGKYTIEERLMLNGKLFRDEQEILDFHAVNDAVIHRSRFNHPLNVTLFINGKEIKEISADGIIISTPTGSTAYNLSAGGPILTPTSQNFVVTPIAPLFGSCSSIVTSSQDIITIKIEKSRMPLDGAIISVDGDDGFSLSQSDVLEISLSPKKFRILKVKDSGFFKVLQNKLSK